MPSSDEAGPSQATGASRESNIISEVNKKSVAAFATQYLTLLPENFRSRHSALMRKFHGERNKMRTSGGSLDEGQKYSCMIAMLNYASAMVHGMFIRLPLIMPYRHAMKRKFRTPTGTNAYFSSSTLTLLP